MNEKPLEFIIYKSDGANFFIKFFYEDKSTEEIVISEKPSGLKLNKHYLIGELYGYPVEDDRKGL